MKIRVDKQWILPVLWLIVIPVGAHLAFSWIGYNPTDDGFILSYSRRLLDGQIPHLDFISIRPIGSAIFHMPVVAFGGAYTYWISRLVVWMQFGCIAWLWAMMLQKAFAVSFRLIDQILVGLIIFAFSAHTFPIMAWHSVDSLFFTTLGVWVCLNKDRKFSMVGYGIAGLAYLARQNFIFMIPMLLFALNDWKCIRCWVSAALPGLGYALFLLVFHALPDAILQLSSQGGALYATAVQPYLSLLVITGLVLGFASYSVQRAGFFSAVNAVVLWGSVFGVGIGLWFGYFQDMTFFLFGLSAGLMLRHALLRNRARAQIGIISLAAAWCISVSLGYNYPALAAGPLAGFIIYCAFGTQQDYERFPRKRLYMQAILGSVVLFFVVGRLLHVYREPAWSQETEDLAGVFPGARHIQVDPNTYRFLEDLQAAVVQTSGKYALIPDLAGYWAASEAVNPLPIDWSISVELNNPSLMSRFTQEMGRQRGKITIIVQKVLASEIAFKDIPIASQRENYPVVQYVKSHFTKIGETTYFELYR